MEADAHTAPDAPATGTDEGPRDVPDWDSGWTDSETVSGQDAGSSAGGEDFSAEEDASGSAASDGESADWREWSGWNDDDERYDADSLDADTSLQGNDGAPAQENQEEDENAASAGTASSDDETESEQDGGDRKKRRRGRRGGRGHGRKSSEGRVAQENEENQTPEHVRTEPVSQTAPQQQRRPAGRRCMYISILPGEQVEVALTNNGVLEEYYLDMLHQKKIKGNIYRGVIHNIDTNLQAAFIDFGEEKTDSCRSMKSTPSIIPDTSSPRAAKNSRPSRKFCTSDRKCLCRWSRNQTARRVPSSPHGFPSPGGSWCSPPDRSRLAFHGRSATKRNVPACASSCTVSIPVMTSVSLSAR